MKRHLFLKKFVAGLAASAAAVGGGSLFGGDRAGATEAPSAATPAACVRSFVGYASTYKVLDLTADGQFTTPCFRRDQLNSGGQTTGGPQRVDVGSTFTISSTTGSFTAINSADGLQVLGFSRDPGARPTKTAWTFNWFGEFDDQPAMRNLEGQLGNSLTGYNDMWLIPPTFDMTGCRDTNLNYDQGRGVTTCTIRLTRGPLYKTGTTGEIPWSIIMGFSPRSGVFNRTPSLTNCAGTCNPVLFGFQNYNEAALFLQPTPYARMVWTINPDDVLTTRFDASTSAYNGTIDRYLWEFRSEDGQWQRDQEGPIVDQSFPGVGIYPVKLTIWAGAQKAELTGTVFLNRDQGGLSVKVDSAESTLRADPSGADPRSRALVRITVTNSGQQPVNALLQPDLFRLPGQPPTEATSLTFADAEPGLDWYNLGTIAPGGSVVRELNVKAVAPGPGRVTAKVNQAEGARQFTIAPGCRVPGAAGACPYIPPRDYLTAFSDGAGGTPGFSFDRSPAAEVTRQGPNGIETWNGSSWGGRPNPRSSDRVAVAPQTWINGAAVGANRVEITEPSAYNGNPTGAVTFQPGDRVIINPGAANQETRRVTALGSLIFDRPLSFAHTTGEMVTFDPIPEVGIPAASPRPMIALATTASLTLLIGIRRRSRGGRKIRRVRSSP